MFARLSRGWSMAKASFTMLRQYPKLAILPATSGVIFLIIIAAILATLVPFGSGRATSNAIWTALSDGKTGNIWFYLSAFGVFYVLASVAIFFNVALIHCALRAHAGEQPSIRAGLAAAVGLLPQILGWAFVATTVGIVLNMITDALKNYLGFLGGLLSGLLEFSWAVITYFVVPVLVTEKVGPITAVKRSAAILRSKWGESLAGEARIGLIGALFFILSALVFAGGAALALSKAAMVAVGVILMVIGVLAAIASMVVMSALSTIFQSGVYLYATTGQVPQSLDRDLLEAAFQPKAKA
jgi:ABC-type multidrug transport system fused ATPase/permease subunit